jgi:hypothetical protein
VTDIPGTENVYMDVAVNNAAEIKKLKHDISRLRQFVDWVDAWVSSPVNSYSLSALDGLFLMTRDGIAALKEDGRWK